MKANGCITHIVIKIADAKKYLSREQFASLELLVSQINIGRLHDGKKMSNEYYICNKDEPYAEQIEKIILDNEK